MEVAKFKMRALLRIVNIGLGQHPVREKNLLKHLIRHPCPYRSAAQRVGHYASYMITLSKSIKTNR